MSVPRKVRSVFAPQSQNPASHSVHPCQSASCRHKKYCSSSCVVGKQCCGTCHCIAFAHTDNVTPCCDGQTWCVPIRIVDSNQQHNSMPNLGSQAAASQRISKIACAAAYRRILQVSANCQSMKPCIIMLAQQTQCDNKRGYHETLSCNSKSNH